MFSDHIDSAIKEHISEIVDSPAGSGPSADGILMEDGPSFIVLESGDYVLKE